MPRLMIAVPHPEESQPMTRTGGRPLAPASFAWPTCRKCRGAMQFIAQIRLSDARDPAIADGLLLLFMCQNQPGACDEWDASSGGNHARVVGLEGLTLLTPPAEGDTLLKEAWGASAIDEDAGSYGAAREAWAARAGQSPRGVLGQLGGDPEWLQGDETPACAKCGEAMRFVAQLEEGPNYQTSINFGGGAAFTFACGGCAGEAKLLWQQ